VNRALRAATMGALLLTPVVLTACSAGQVNQTSSQDRDKVGPSVQVGDLEVRQVSIVHPCEAAGDEDATAYEQGDDPEVVLTIVNSGREDDTLTGVEGELFDGVYVDELPSQTTTTPQTTAAAPTTSAPGTAGAPGSSGAPGTSTAPTPVVPTAAQPTATDDPDIEIPAQSSITIGLRQYEADSPCDPEVAADTTRLFLADLDVDRDSPLTPSQSVVVTFTFENAGEVTVPALVAGPHGAVARGEGFDFNQGEGAEQGNEQDTETE
jgi:copper(I)-binding protein